jgi:hypothetical protein
MTSTSYIRDVWPSLGEASSSSWQRHVKLWKGNQYDFKRLHRKANWLILALVSLLV